MISAAPLTPTRHDCATESPSFDSLLPSIQKCVAFAFRRLPRGRRRELEQDAIANAYVEFTRLLKRGLGSLAYPTPLAKFAVRQVLDGRRVGCRQNARDLSSPCCQSKNHIVLDRLHQQLSDGQWQERLVADRRATPAELVAAKLDFGTWLDRLDGSKRAIALRLAAGDTPSEAAQFFHVSRARLSQVRRELRKDWAGFSHC
jgi:hypothetical protein